ncbi:MAG: ABC transporter ATP-binding protein [Actinomycetota bacterium]
MLRVEGVGKTFDPPGVALRSIVRTASSEPVCALHRVDLHVDPGEIVGLVGPNGAGKSTLIRICASLLTPSHGRVLVDGVDTATSRAAGRARVGLLLTDERAFYWRLTGKENLRFFGVMAGLSPQEASRRANVLLVRFGLAHRDRRVFGYSSGMRVRLGLARALIGSPGLLILDEPTRSLDPVASDEFIAAVRGLAASGTAILLSSHRLEEVAASCHRSVVLVNGHQRGVVQASPEGAGPDGAVRQLRALLQDME